jgi:hypothetical protein
MKRMITITMSVTSLVFLKFSDLLNNKENKKEKSIAEPKAMAYPPPIYSAPNASLSAAKVLAASGNRE